MRRASVPSDIASLLWEELLSPFQQLTKKQQGAAAREAGEQGRMESQHHQPCHAYQASLKPVLLP